MYFGHSICKTQIDCSFNKRLVDESSWEMQKSHLVFRIKFHLKLVFIVINENHINLMLILSDLWKSELRRWVYLFYFQHSWNCHFLVLIWLLSWTCNLISWRVHGFEYKTLKIILILRYFLFVVDLTTPMSKVNSWCQLIKLYIINLWDTPCLWDRRFKF